jgi:hypothetical protein
MSEMQDDTLTGTLSSVDVATKENLENLVKVGEKLLKKPVSRVDLGTGVFTPVDKMTSEEALIKCIYICSSLYIIVISMASYFIFADLFLFDCIGWLNYCQRRSIFVILGHQLEKLLLRSEYDS